MRVFFYCQYHRSIDAFTHVCILSTVQRVFHAHCLSHRFYRFKVICVECIRFFLLSLRIAVLFLLRVLLTTTVPACVLHTPLSVAFIALQVI